MCENKNKHEMYEYQFSLDNFEIDDDQNAFNDQVYDDECAKRCRPLETQPKSAPKKPMT